MTVTIKEKKSGQRACDEKNAKGELCCGHLKLWHEYGEEISGQVGKEIPVYRCERCHAVYRPMPDDSSSAGSNYREQTVNLLGLFMRKK